MLTQAQRTTLAAAMRASTNPDVINWVATRQDNAIVAWLNSDASPTVKAWITSQSVDVSDEAPNYSLFDSLLAGKRDSWVLFLRANRDFSKAKVRTWVTDVWGNATAGSNAEAVLLAATRNANNLEVIFGGVDRTTGTVTAQKLTLEGQATSEDVGRALNENP